MTWSINHHHLRRVGLEWLKQSSGWWLGHPSEKYESQLGWLETQYMGKKNDVPNHQPVMAYKVYFPYVFRIFPGKNQRQRRSWTETPNEPTFRGHGRALDQLRPARLGGFTELGFGLHGVYMGFKRGFKYGVYIWGKKMVKGGMLRKKTAWKLLVVVVFMSLFNVSSLPLMFYVVGVLGLFYP